MSRNGCRQCFIEHSETPSYPMYLLWSAPQPHHACVKIGTSHTSGNHWTTQMSILASQFCMKGQWLIINVCNGTRITGLLTFIRCCSWSSVYFYIWGDWGVSWLPVVTYLLWVESGIEWHFSTIRLLFISHKLSCTMKAVLKWAVLNHA